METNNENKNILSEPELRFREELKNCVKRIVDAWPWISVTGSVVIGGEALLLLLLLHRCKKREEED